MLLSCTRCQAKVDAEELASAEYVDDDFVEFRVLLLKCPSCYSPIVARQIEAGRFNYGEGRTHVHYGAPERLYPAERNIHPQIPEAIRRSIEEARRCLDHRCYVASAIMCRRTLEALCKHHGTQAWNLAGALKELHDSKVIDDRLYEWAEALRADGNLAAHDPEATFSRQDAEDLAEFSEAILEYVFVLSDRFAAFKARRAQAANPEPAPVAKVGAGDLNAAATEVAE